MEKIEINGETFVKESDLPKQATSYNTQKDEEGRVCSIIRTYSAGVFIGYVGDIIGKLGTIYNSRRIWYWDGACAICQLATEGSKNIEKCKIAVVVPEKTLTEIIEVIPCSEVSVKILMGADEWKK